MKLLTITLFVVASWAVIIYAAYDYGYNHRELTYKERQQIAIEFMSHGTWRYTLCNLPLDSDRGDK